MATSARVVPDHMLSPSSTTLVLEASEQPASPATPKSENAGVPARYRRMFGIRNDHEIRQFRRNLPKIIASIIEPNTSNPPQIDVFFKRTAPSDQKDASAGRQGSKLSFEAKIKEHLGSWEPLLVTYKVREATTVSHDTTETGQTQPASLVANSTIPKAIDTERTTIASHPFIPSTLDEAFSASAKTQSLNSTSGHDSPIASFARISLEVSAKLGGELRQASRERDEALARVQLLEEELKYEKEAHQATLVNLEAARHQILHITKTTADSGKSTKTEVSPKERSGAVSEKQARGDAGAATQLQYKASSIVNGMEAFLDAYNNLMSPDDDYLPYSTASTVHQQNLANLSQPKYCNNHGNIHPDIYCDACNAAVRGIRWKCSACPDLDFCNECYHQEREKHVMHRGGAHLFLAIHKPTRLANICGVCGQVRKCVGSARPPLVDSHPEELSSSVPSTSSPESCTCTKASSTLHSPQPSAGIRNMSVQILKEPIPLSSELTPSEKSSLTARIISAGAGAGKELKDLLLDVQNIPENATSADQFIIDVDYITRKQYAQILTVLDEVAAKGKANCSDASKSAPAEVQPPIFKTTSMTEVQEDNDDDKLAYDCVLATYEEDESSVIATNTGTRTWTKKSLSLRRCCAGGEWWNTDASIVYCGQNGEESDFVAPGMQVIWRKARDAVSSPDKFPSVDIFFRMAITLPDGRCQRFGEQLMIPAGLPLSSCATNDRLRSSSPAYRVSRDNETDSARGETVTEFTSISLSGSSVLAIPVASEAIHSDEEAMMAASIPSRPSPLECGLELSGGGHAVDEDVEVTSQHSGHTDAYHGELLRSPSYEGGSTHSDRDPFDVIVGEDDVSFEDLDEDRFIVVDAATDEESVTGA